MRKYLYFVHFFINFLFCIFLLGFIEANATLQIRSEICCILKIYLGVEQSLAFMAKFIFDLIAVYDKVLKVHRNKYMCP